MRHSTINILEQSLDNIAIQLNNFLAQTDRAWDDSSNVDIDIAADDTV